MCFVHLAGLVGYGLVRLDIDPQSQPQSRLVLRLILWSERGSCIAIVLSNISDKLYTPMTDLWLSISGVRYHNLVRICGTRLDRVCKYITTLEIQLSTP
jgi:hypothetical protein